VGAVVVKNGKIISKAYHKVFGGPHAEVIALQKAGSNAKGSTLYVNLEPCSHFGKTPPCVDKIIESGVKKVVLSIIDPNPLVLGKGIQKLRNNGIKVETGVLKNEGIWLNKFFVKFITQNKPYVTLKIAQTLDSKITHTLKKRVQITCEESKNFVNELRHEYDAVMIGSNTARIDNPSLLVQDSSKSQPIRIILDTDLTLPHNLKIFTDDFRQLTFLVAGNHKVNTKETEWFEKHGIKLIFVNRLQSGKLNLENLLEKLGENNFSSVLIEGGTQLFSSFVKYNLFDEINFLVAPKLFGRGLDAFSDIGSLKSLGKLKLEFREVKKVGADLFIQIIKPDLFNYL
ncbi:MAG: bifunctional diaminohydroxyphosphoribosylaminopyrimidine deaminase/5-amino-6-(5-phosphoribosylamino)uracil reductase RibD, partial [Ignavibacteria bacterium]|nr:bifunctional diaminohydroxyphosphoribosylaminopyrimidine deaminase/5-amino-6-(5-phosphoribosylamino)uracil reductase RibD [Ignavibacteria bacterium]